ncbi:septation protein SepH [Nocardioides sp.]|uniref:septation protein SepH n=1 Tax=Nocardioides sp. TaxID=35761 RepID=UPI0026163006|nr:septation protein SepH [Nocardioides sp.]MDI6908595.1 septation protein SepH [Nocardioides sp.]
MAHLTLAGVSDDGLQLRLVDAEGVEHTVDVDDRLRAALRGDRTRRWETKMDSALRPRDIQARIRSGESPEAVAQAAQTSVDKIMAFAAPVLAERQHVAERAQRSSVRRTDGGQAAAGARTLGDAAASHLRAANVDPATVEWDAWRREDGRWSLTASYSSPERSGTAELTFDAPGNYVTLDNEDARWLVGEAVAAAAPAPDDLRHARQRRLSAVGDLDQELPLGEDAIGLVSEQPVEAFLDDEPPADPEVAAEQAGLREEAAQAAAEDDLHRGELEDDRDDRPREEHHHEPPVRRPVKKTRGRASVPSWDEIMFGPSEGDGA